MPESVPAMSAPPRARDNPLTRSLAGVIGLATLAVLVLACLGSLPWTLGSAGVDPFGRDLPARYKHGDLSGYLLPPTWAGMSAPEQERFDTVALHRAQDRLLAERVARLRAELLPPNWTRLTPDERTAFADSLAPDRAAAVRALIEGSLPPGTEAPRPTPEQIDAARPFYILGTDKLGRDLLVRCLAGGGVSIGIGLAAAAMSVVIGTLYGAAAGYIGGRTDAFLMRVVDILYGLPYLLFVVLLAVSGDALIGAFESRQGRELSDGARSTLEVLILLAAIGGLSWLTMSRVIRGQVLSLKAQPFMEAARAMGVPVRLQFARHLLPNLLGPIIVYATLTVPQAILQESFLSFLGIGVRPPLPSWGNLAADGLIELNPVRFRLWLLVAPSVLLGVTLLALNFVGEGLREAFDPKRSKR